MKAHALQNAYLGFSKFLFFTPPPQKSKILILPKVKANKIENFEDIQKTEYIQGEALAFLR